MLKFTNMFADNRTCFMVYLGDVKTKSMRVIHSEA